jgi:hypothetical protein
MRLFVLDTNLHIFQAIFIALKEPEKKNHFIVSSKAKNSPYRERLEQLGVVSYRDDIQKSGFSQLLCGLDYDNEFLRNIFREDFSEIYVSNPNHSIASVLFHRYKKKAKFFIVDDGLSTACLVRDWQYETVIYRLKRGVKNSIRFVYYVFGFEILSWGYPFQYINKKNKYRIVLVPELMIDEGPEIVPFSSLCNQSKMLEDIGRMKTGKKYEFLSFYTEEKTIDCDKDIVYVGHPRIRYTLPCVIQHVPSEYIVLGNDVCSQSSSLILVYIMGRLYLDTHNILFVKGDLHPRLEQFLREKRI